MPEPDDFGLSGVRTLSHVGDSSRSVRHASFWKTWMGAVLAEQPRLAPRGPREMDPSDPSATHEFGSARHVRIGCSLVMPKGRPRAGLVALHGYENVPTLGQTASDFAPLAERGVAVLAVRIRGYPGSRVDVPRLVEHAAAPEGGGGNWITHGLESPTSEAGYGSDWVVSYAVADVVNACRALRAFLGSPRESAPIYMHGESMGAALAVLGASQLADHHEVSRLVIGLPSLGDWPWRLAHHACGLGAGGLIRRFMADYPALEQDIATTLRVFDTVIHARRVRCAVLCKLALRDEVVPAPTAAAVFNALGSDPGRKWRFTVRYGHHDGGVADMRRHALFDRLALEFLDPAIDPTTRDWESDAMRPASGAEPKPAPLRAPAAAADEPTLFGAGPLPSKETGEQDLIAAYISTGRTLDDLPYTPEFERLYLAAGGAGRAEREVFHKLHNLRKAGKLPRLGKPASTPPLIDAREEAALAELVVAAVGSLGQRDQLPYSEQFEPLVAAFNQRTGRSLSPHDVWRLVAKLAK